MYDVQPADEPGWISSPFAAVTADVPGAGPSIVARGAANSKGSLASFLLALASARRVSDLPAEIVFLVDGEEELGSPNLPNVMSDRRADLTAEAAFDMDLTANRRDISEVYLGCKGIVSFILSCSGGEWGGPMGRALHSSEGVIISSPAWSLTRALTALEDAARHNDLDGLGPATVPPEDEGLLDALARDFDPAAHLEESNALTYRGADDARSLLKALMYEPVLNLNGFSAGSVTGKTIVPHEARAALDVRIAYGTNVESVVASIERIVAETSPEVAVEEGQLCPPSRTTANSPVARDGRVPERRGAAAAGVALGPLVGALLPLRAGPWATLRVGRRRARGPRARRRRVRDHRRPEGAHAPVYRLPASLRTRCRSGGVRT
jgi:acetylornithine deacetylase/succinyl-diaminopimelate desuccinylase-like protein